MISVSKIKFSILSTLFGVSVVLSFGFNNSRLNNTDSLLNINDTVPVPLFDISILGNYTTPFKGKVISPYGPRGKQMHTGTDIKLQLGDTVRAAFDGIVTRSDDYFGYGNMVVINHNSGFETYYAHLSKCIVNLGDTVKSGAVIGLGGRTGRATTTHLHFEIRLNNIAYNASQLFDFQSDTKISNLYFNIIKNKTQRLNQLSSRKIKLEKKLNIETKIKSRAIEGSTRIQETKKIKIHIIKKGDTLYSLARFYGTSVARLKEINNLSNNEKLRIGMKLKWE
jgi:murein DD-endopeptidase MepM/ murein hydrolase activator NlpD